MKRTDTKAGRFYDSPGGRKLPSVTTILSALAKPALIGWAAKEERLATIHAAYQIAAESVAAGECPDQEQWAKDVQERMGHERAHARLMKDAAAIGTAVHAWIEWQLRNELDVEGKDDHQPDLSNPVVAACVAKWQQWRAGVSLVPLAVEKRLACQDYGFAGTLDLLAEVEGVVTVIDFKTGKAVYAEAFLQNAAYRMALAEEGITTEAGLIVRLPKSEADPDFEVVAVPPLDELMIPFVCLIPVWRWMRNEEVKYQAKRKQAKE